jgi:DNA-binding transcriptional ArsR family regulator
MAARSTVRRAELVRSAPARPAIRDFTGSARYTVEWDVRTVYDFVFSLSDDAGSTDDLPTPDREWLTAAKAELRTDLGDAVDLYASEVCTVLAGLAVDRPDVTRAADFVTLIRALDQDEIIRMLLVEDLGHPETRQLTERALAGDDAAIEELVELHELHHRSRREAFTTIYRAPAKVVDAARAVLVAWLPRFEEVEERVGSMIRRDYEERAADRVALDPVDLVEKTTGGIRWLSEPGTRRVILAPSYFARPYNFLLSADGWRLFGYPIGDDALDGTDPLAPPAALVRLHRALGDDTRLRILKLLSTRDWYLSEIAQQLELSKPTIKHHLALLRAAGLVTLTEESSLTYYSLRRTRLADASTDAIRFLGG